MAENLQAIKQRFGIVGRSPALDNALSTAVRVSPFNLSVLIVGESGVGKEVFSKIIHGLSPRKHNKFIAINCGAIPEGTINSELFGHEKGAFTGATGERKGYFETVDGGTIFLDEIGEMPLDTQAFLLRVLETGEFIRVGSSKVQKTDVRVIAATNVDLQERVAKGKFREDLFYRLNTVPIKVPSVRDRRPDIYMLFRKFAVDFAEKYRTSPVNLDEKGYALLENYSWPGNVREIKNMAEQISVLAEERQVDADKLLELFPHLLHRNLPSIPNRKEGLEEREILYNLLFDMKKDLNDLKGLVYGLIQDNDLRLPADTNARHLLPSPNKAHKENVLEENAYFNQPKGNQEIPVIERQEDYRLIIDPAADEPYHRMQEVEENLSLEDMEKDLILKALKKHRGRRKEAAKDLGISERTLYRKIKQYDL